MRLLNEPPEQITIVIHASDSCSTVIEAATTKAKDRGGARGLLPLSEWLPEGDGGGETDALANTFSGSLPSVYVSDDITERMSVLLSVTDMTIMEQQVLRALLMGYKKGVIRKSVGKAYDEAVAGLRVKFSWLGYNSDSVN